MPRVNIIPLIIHVDMKFPLTVQLEECFNIQYNLTNYRNSETQLRYEIENTNDIYISGFSKNSLKIPSGGSATVEVFAVGIKAGELKVPSIKITDELSS
jgi:hypothetical protein